MKKLTFIIACFNQVEHTKKTVTSIIKNSPPDSFNFVFIDNGSTDGTHNYISNVKDAVVIRNEYNRYVNPAWNQGFKYVLDHDMGDYICLCNNDVEVGQNWLDPIFSLFELDRKEWYVPTSNCHDDHPPFRSTSEFYTYCTDLPYRSLVLSPVTTNFVGFCMFFRKDNIKLFYPIPETLKVIRGDDWLTDCITSDNWFCFRVSHCAVHHFGSATQQAIGQSLGPVRDRDVAEFIKLYDNTYRSMGMKRIFDHRFAVGLL